MTITRYHLSTAADADAGSIPARTDEHFGELTRLRYEYLLLTALRDLAIKPDRIGTIHRAPNSAHMYEAAIYAAAANGRGTRPAS